MNYIQYSINGQNKMYLKLQTQMLRRKKNSQGSVYQWKIRSTESRQSIVLFCGVFFFTHQKNYLQVSIAHLPQV